MEQKSSSLQLLGQAAYLRYRGGMAVTAADWYVSLGVDNNDTAVAEAGGQIKPVRGKIDRMDKGRVEHLKRWDTPGGGE